MMLRLLCRLLSKLEKQGSPDFNGTTHVCHSEPLDARRTRAGRRRISVMQSGDSSRPYGTLRVTIGDDPNLGGLEDLFGELPQQVEDSQRFELYLGLTQLP